MLKVSVVSISLTMVMMATISLAHENRFLDDTGKNDGEVIKKITSDVKIGIAEKILGTFDSNFYKLPIRKQGHYALRRYRTTGNRDFLNTSLSELYFAADHLHSLCHGIKSKAYRYEHLSKVSNTREMLGTDKVRIALRQDSIKKYPDHIFFAHILLPELNRVNEFGMQLKGNGEQLRQALSGFNFRQGFTDPDMIRAWAAKQANQVYWLYNMVLGDYRKVYMDAFRKVYPDNKDRLLSYQQYRTKITGMTHFVISASLYYQESVNDDYLEWVISYFQNKIDIIIDRVDLGPLSEVGISLLLTGKSDSIAVQKITRKLVESYNKKHQMILSANEQLDIEFMQHRNLLGGIFLGWQGCYFPGPYLYKMKQFSMQMPSVLEREYGY